ncbi:MAG: hypothetical protein WD993_11015 [Thermoleophilaceae bacterium]
MALPTDNSHLDSAALEDHVFELLADHTTLEIAEELGMTLEDAAEVVYKVITERSTPNLVAAREAIDRLSKIRFV